MKLEDIKKPKIYTMKETAEFMKISPITLWRLAKRGIIKHINIAKTGKREIYGFRPEDIQKYYDSLSHSDRGTQSVNQ